MINYQFELERLRTQLSKLNNDEEGIERKLEIFEKFCERLNIRPEGPFPKTQQELLEMQQRGVAPHMESALEMYLGINGVLEEHALSKEIDATLDQQNREYRGDAPHAETHLNQAENNSPDPDGSPNDPNWPPKPMNWPPKP